MPPIKLIVINDFPTENIVKENHRTAKIRLEIVLSSKIGFIDFYLHLFDCG